MYSKEKKNIGEKNHVGIYIYIYVKLENISSKMRKFEVFTNLNYEDR